MDNPLCDKLGREYTQRDYVAKEGVGVLISAARDKLWVCVDGISVLRVKGTVKLDDMSVALTATTEEEQ